MDRAEKDSVWRTEEDIKANEQEVIKTALAYLGTSPPTDEDEDSADKDADTLCRRGLESLLAGESKRRLRRQHKLQVIDAVMDVQDEQWDLGHDVANPTLIRAASKALTKGDTDKALHRAKSDEAFVRRMAG